MVTPARHLATASASIVVMPPAIAALVDGVRIRLRPDELAHVLGHFEDLEHAVAAAITGAAAALAAAGFVITSPALKPITAKRGSLVESCGRQAARHLAAIAQHPHQALRDHGAQRRLQQKALDAEIDQPRHGGRRGIGMQRGQHEMAGQRGMDRNMRGLGVAHLADHDDVGVLTDEGAHRGGEGQPDRRLDLRLVDAGNFVFDRILDGEDLARRLVQDRQHGRERRGLAAAGRPGDDDHAVRQRQQARHDRFVPRDEAELADLEQAAVARQQADDGAFAVLRRHGGDADIEFGAADANPRRAVLRQPPLRDVRVRPES